MKDYEKVEQAKKELFRAIESRNFLIASLNALDDSLEEKLKTVEAIQKDYDGKALRLQNAIANVNEQIGVLEARVEGREQEQKDNVRKAKNAKGKITTTIKKSTPEKTKKVVVKKEPEPVFIEAEPESQEVIDPSEVEKNENGKKECPLCGKEFSSQGFAAHLRSCLDKQDGE